MDLAKTGRDGDDRHETVVWLGPGTESPFHDPVFQGVITQHGYSSSWSKEVKSGIEPLLECFQFCVDGDAESLEGASGGVTIPLETSRDRIGDDGRKLCCCCDGAGPGDGSGNPPGHRILAIAPDDLGEFGYIGLVDDFGGSTLRAGTTSSTAGSLPEPHVERSFLSVAKAARRVIQLYG